MSAAGAGKKRKTADGGDSESEEGRAGGAGAGASAPSAGLTKAVAQSAKSQEGIVPKVALTMPLKMLVVHDWELVHKKRYLPRLPCCRLQPAPGAALTTTPSTAAVASSSASAAAASSESSTAEQQYTETMRGITMPSYAMRSVAGVLQDFLAHTQALGQTAGKTGAAAGAAAKGMAAASSSSSDTPTGDASVSGGGAKKRARREENGSHTQGTGAGSGAGTATATATAASLGKGQKKGEGGTSSSASAAMPVHLQSVCKDVVDALRMYFEKVAHVLLLFKFERCYFEIWNKEKRPFLKDEAGQAMNMPSYAECFPAIFLLRLLVRFPGLLGTYGKGSGAGTGLTREEADAVSGVLQELVKFLSKNSKNKSYFGTGACCGCTHHTPRRRRLTPSYMPLSFGCSDTSSCCCISLIAEAYIKANTAYNAEMDKLIVQGVEGLTTAGAAGGASGSGTAAGGGGPNILTRPTFLKALKMGYANCVTDAVPL